MDLGTTEVRDICGIDVSISQASANSRTAQMQIAIPPEVKGPTIINGVDAIEDKVFFEHFVSRLSKVLSFDGRNAFRNLLLPLAIEHAGLMHSLLALSGSSINFTDPYGVSLLATHPKTTLTALRRRSMQHKVRALQDLGIGLDMQRNRHDRPSGWLPRYGQVLCLYLQSIKPLKATGEHRIHLRTYQKLTETISTEINPLTEFIKEYFKFHNAVDVLTQLPPKESESLASLSDDWRIEAFKNQDSQFCCLCEIYVIRNQIRSNMANGRDPVVSREFLNAARKINIRIQEWAPPGADIKDAFTILLGLLYKQVILIYLWRTVYPPRSRSWLVHPKITEAVDDGISLLTSIPACYRSKPMLVAPAFIIGCAAFNATQRTLVRESIEMTKIYTNSKTADRVFEVLEIVWRRMDDKDERSWDWERTAHDLRMDVLVN